MSARPIHAVPLYPDPGTEHWASSTCPCRPEKLLRDLATTADVYVHHASGAPRATGNPLDLHADLLTVQRRLDEVLER